MRCELHICTKRPTDRSEVADLSIAEGTVRLRTQDDGVWATEAQGMTKRPGTGRVWVILLDEGLMQTHELVAPVFLTAGHLFTLSDFRAITPMAGS